MVRGSASCSRVPPFRFPLRSRSTLEIDSASVTGQTTGPFVKKTERPESRSIEIVKEQPKGGGPGKSPAPGDAEVLRERGGTEGVPGVERKASGK